MTILADHNVEGHATILLGVLGAEGGLEIFPMRLATLAQMGLPYDGSDRAVWRFAQENGMILLTANRRMEEEDSLEKTIRDENTPASLPVLTIGNVNRMVEKTYRERCATRLLEIGLNLKNYLGTGRIFIP